MHYPLSDGAEQAARPSKKFAPKKTKQYKHTLRQTGECCEDSKIPTAANGSATRKQQKQMQ